MKTGLQLLSKETLDNLLHALVMAEQEIKMFYEDDNDSHREYADDIYWELSKLSTRVLYQIRDNELNK